MNKRLCKFIVLFLCCLIAYYPVIISLVGVWLKDSNNSHGILVPFISLYLLWEKKTEIAAEVAKEEEGSNYIALIMLAASLALYLLFQFGHILLVPNLMLVTSVILLVHYYFGRATFRLCSFPLLFLFFMVPIPVSFKTLFTLPMKTFATNVAVPIIRLLGIPVLQEGNIIQLANTTLEVAEACSGIRSLVAMLMLGTLFSSFIKDAGWKRYSLIAIAPIVAVVANILRISGTGILAYYYGVEAAKGYVHEVSGILVFVFGFVVLSAIYRLIESWGKSCA